MRNELKQKAIDGRKFMESYESACSSLQAALSALDFAHICRYIYSIESKALKNKDRISFKLNKKLITSKGNMEYRNCPT